MLWSQFRQALGSKTRFSSPDKATWPKLQEELQEVRAALTVAGFNESCLQANLLRLLSRQTRHAFLFPGLHGSAA